MAPGGSAATSKPPSRPAALAQEVPAVELAELVPAVVPELAEEAAAGEPLARLARRRSSAVRHSCGQPADFVPTSRRARLCRRKSGA